MNIHLTPELEQLVHSKVQTGRYNSASEVVREALRLMEERDQVKAIQREEIRKKIAAGLKSLEEGRVYDGEAFFGQMEFVELSRSHTRRGTLTGGLDGRAGQVLARCLISDHLPARAAPYWDCAGASWQPRCCIPS